MGRHSTIRIVFAVIDNMIRQRLEAALAEGQDKQNKDSFGPDNLRPKPSLPSSLLPGVRHLA